MSVKNMKLTLFELYCTCLVHSGANTEVHFFCSYFMSELWCYSSTPSSVFFFSLKAGLKEALVDFSLLSCTAV